MSYDIKEEVVEVDEPVVAEGIFFRQGLQCLEKEDYKKAVRSFERVTHSRHYGPHYFLGLALLRMGERPVQESLLVMLRGLEMMLERCGGEITNADPNILGSFAEEIKIAVSQEKLLWENEEFESNGGFEELQTLVQEVKAQLEKGKLDHGLITELCCAVVSILKP